MTSSLEPPRTQLHPMEVRLVERGRDSLREVDDETLARLLGEAGDLARRFGWDGWDDVPPAASFLIDDLLGAITNERIDRANALDAARIAVDANGHEVHVGHDEVMDKQVGGGGWFAYCSCEADLHDFDGKQPSVTEDEARRVAGEHAAEHEGRWAS